MLEFLYTEILVYWNPCVPEPLSTEILVYQNPCVPESLCAKTLVCRNCHTLQILCIGCFMQKRLRKIAAAYPFDVRNYSVIAV